MRAETTLVRRLAILLPTGALIGSLTAACGGGSWESMPGATAAASRDAHPEEVVELSPEKLAVVGIETAAVELRRLSPQLETTGEVGYEEDRIAHVAPRVPGRVQHVPVSLGDEVRRGQILATLDSVELGQATAAYLTARTREELARQSYEREQRLYGDRITSEREMLEARAAHLEAISERQSAQETLRLYGVPGEKLAGLGPEDPTASLLPVYAPISGQVVAKHATLGELATPEDILFTIGDLGHVWIWIDVYERDLAQVHLGDGVEVVVEPYPDRTFSGEVTYLAPVVAADTRTVRARIDVENAERMLRPGMFATVRLTDPHTEDVSESLVVPESAVVRRNDRTQIFVPAGSEEQGRARFEVRVVAVGRQEGPWVEILSGLDPADRVVTTGAFYLESELARRELGGAHEH